MNQSTTQGSLNPRFFERLLAFVALLVGAVSCGGTDGDTVTFVSGRASYPVAGVLGRAEPTLGSAPVIFDDFTPPEFATPQLNPVLGRTDGSGAFAISVEDTRLIVLSVELVQNDRLLRTSSFIVSDGTIQTKDLTGLTTLATAALRSAIDQNLIELEEISVETISRYEDASRFVASQFEIDLDDEPSLTAAVTEINRRIFPESQMPSEDDEQEENEEEEEEEIDQEEPNPDQVDGEMLSATPSVAALRFNSATDFCPKLFAPIRLSLTDVNGQPLRGEPLLVETLPEYLRSLTPLVTNSLGQATLNLSYTCQNSTLSSTSTVLQIESTGGATLLLAVSVTIE